MKKKLFSTAAVVVITIAGMAVIWLTGCVTTFDKRLMDPGVSTNDHAVLFIPSEINDVTIDDDKVTGGDPGLWGFAGRRSSMTVLAPGEHSIRSRYYDVQSGNTDTTTVTSTGYITVVHNFQAGRRYFFNVNKEGNNIRFQITDETDNESGHWLYGKWVKRANKKMSKVKYPSKVALAVTYKTQLENANATNPTQLEGTWCYDYTVGFAKFPVQDTYSFTGNTYSFEAGDGNTFKNHKGTFILTENAVTLTVLKKFKFMGFAGMKSKWINVKQENLTYEYSLTPQGPVLTSKNKPVRTFLRQAGKQPPQTSAEAEVVNEIGGEDSLVE